MELFLKNLDGKDIKKINFLENINVEANINKNLIHECIVNYLANQRQGTSSTKTRAEVSGGGKKPWKQKGTGRARCGSNRSPLWRHGGVAFGPKPRDYYYSMPDKKKKKGLLNALVLKCKENQIIAVETFFNQNIEKTKQVDGILKNLKTDGKSIIVLKGKEENFVRATKNIQKLSWVYVDNINIHDVMSSDNLILDMESVEFLNQKFGVGK